MTGDIYVLTKNDFSWIPEPTEIILVSTDSKLVFGFDVDDRDRFPYPDYQNVKIDVWRDGELYNTYLRNYEKGYWVEQISPETKKRREQWEADEVKRTGGVNV